MKRFITEFAHYAIEHNHSCYFRKEIDRRTVIDSDERIRAALKAHDRGIMTVKETMHIISENTH